MRDIFRNLVPGMVSSGNINLHNRPRVKNRDGSISTVRSISVGVAPHREVLIPTVVGKRVVSNDRAIQHYQKTGQHLGVFLDSQSANRYAVKLHKAQAKEYTPVIRSLAHGIARRGK